MFNPFLQDPFYSSVTWVTAAEGSNYGFSASLKLLLDKTTTFILIFTIWVCLTEISAKYGGNITNHNWVFTMSARV